MRIPVGYRTGVLVTSLLLASEASADATKVHPLPSCTAPPKRIIVDQLYSQRALRRARTLLQLRMLELRKAELDRVRQAILRRLPAGLLPQTGDSGG
jgi:hypothetical protein